MYNLAYDELKKIEYNRIINEVVRFSTLKFLFGRFSYETTIKLDCELPKYAGIDGPRYDPRRLITVIFTASNVYLA